MTSAQPPVTGAVHDLSDLRPCGRCRRSFERDATLHPDAIPEWWVCDECRKRLFGPERKPGS